MPRTARADDPFALRVATNVRLSPDGERIAGWLDHDLVAGGTHLPPLRR